MSSDAIIGLIGIVVSAIIGPVCILFFTNYFKRKEREAAKKEEQEKKQIQESRDENFRQLSMLIDGMVKPINNKVDDIAEELKKTDGKVEMVIRDKAIYREETVGLVEDSINKLYAEQVSGTVRTMQEIKNDLEEIKANEEQLKKANRASLRNQLLEAWHKCEKQGYTTEHERENFLRMYQAYTAIGGNSFIQCDIKPKFDALLTEEQYKANKKKSTTKK